ncbi:MAG: hypothetical protein HEP80_17675 [Dolichospermum sp. UKL201]|nr:MAG: hypothetical protein HEP80_17675 [Dolichospermum sp. UKL201]
MNHYNPHSTNGILTLSCKFSNPGHPDMACATLRYQPKILLEKQTLIYMGAQISTIPKQ